MKDAKGHGSDSHGGAAHQNGVRNIPNLIRAFVKDEKGTPGASPWSKAVRGYIMAPANGVDPFMDALSHVSTWAEHLGEHEK